MRYLYLSRQLRDSLNRPVERPCDHDRSPKKFQIFSI